MNIVELYDDMVVITIIGMGTVFFALIGLSFMLDILRVSFGPEEYRKSKKAKKTEEAVVETMDQPVEELNHQVIAAITAAISVYLGKPTPEFIITGINRIPMSTPIWNHGTRNRELPRR